MTVPFQGGGFGSTRGHHLEKGNFFASWYRVAYELAAV